MAKEKNRKILNHNSILKIVIGGMLVALEIVLERYLGISSNITRYSPAFIARTITGSIFGPFWTAAICVMADYIGATIIYGSSNIFLSITALARGFLYGLFFKKKITLLRIIELVVAEQLGCSLLLNSVILHYMYGVAYKALFATRIVQVAVMIPVQIIIIYIMSRTLLPILKRMFNQYSEEAIKKVNSVITQGSKPGLSRVSNFSRLLGSPERNLKIIHVAGTNGKGSTSNMLANVLMAQGYKVGVFNSPYLSTAIEYFNVNGKLVSEEEFSAITSNLAEIVKKNIGTELKEAPTEFEFYTCAALKYYADMKCDFAVLEVGMGGREDATNFIDAPELAVITNIGIDHENWLGGSLEDIAKHKAGIIKKGSAVVYYPSEDAACTVIEETCHKENVDCIKADFSRLNSYTVYEKSMSSVVYYETFTGKKYEIKLNTPASFQARNAAVALEGVEVLKNRGIIISDEAVMKGFENFTLPARFEILSKSPLVIADGGHNPQCISALSESFSPLAEGKKVVVLTGVMRDKDYTLMYDEINRFASEYIVVSTGTERALSTEELKSVLEKYGKPVTVCDTPSEGAKTAYGRVSKNDCLLITGTFYMMDEIRKAILK